MRFLKKFPLKRVQKSGGNADEFAAIEPAGPLYVIGDVHGQIDLLFRLLQRIDDRLVVQDEPDARLVFVGDYVDRGEHSREVLAAMVALTTKNPGQVTALMGNHEKMMLDFIDQPEERGARWLRNGGLQTLASFGVGGITAGSRPELMLKARDEMLSTLPDGWEDWLRALPLRTESGNVHVVHAAADPDVPMNEQVDRTLLWGSGGFFQKTRQDGIWVVHGHTVVENPSAENGRIAVDTGAVFTSVLTAACIRQGSVTFLSA